MKALWSRPAKEITDDEHHEFYKQIAHDWTDALETIHFKSEGTFEYDALLFLPSHAPFDLYSRAAKRGMHLYVNRVFIMDECDALMPHYLRFVAGVVDAHDLSLNVSCELLQHDRHIRGVRRRLVKKEGQKEIYYLTGASRTAVENSPHMEAFAAKGYEVLILADPIDEVWADQNIEFDGKPLRSIAKGQVDLDTPDEETGEETEPKPQPEQFALGCFRGWTESPCVWGCSSWPGG
jgi:HSP90 family molecular chaperone